MKSVAIIGLGLIGGSWALALKKHFSGITILGVKQIAKQCFVVLWFDN